MAKRYSSHGAELDVGDGHHDALFEVLSDKRRRFALQYLRNTETPTTFDELASALETWEEADPEQTHGHSDSVASSLHHIHLPKMDEAAVLEYDGAHGRVTLTEGIEEMTAQLEAMSAK